jgi:glycosyltransferase involved in cell wall biosynthesis
MRVLVVNYEFPPIGAGGGKASQEIAEHLVEMGHVVRVITARPIQWYQPIGNLMALLGLAFWVYLAYSKVTINIDISDHGFTILGTLLLLAGIQFRVMGMMWELIIPFRGLKPVEFIEGVEVQRVPVLRQRQEYCSTFEMFTFMVSGALHSLKLAREFRPDIVHIFFGVPCGPIGWLLKRMYGLPYIISLRGADVPSEEVKRFAREYKVIRPFVRYLWRDADALVAVSNGLRSYAWQTDPEAEIEVIPNAIDLSVFIPGPLREEEGAVRLLFVGRLIAFKNIETLLEAVALLDKMGAGPFELELVGEGEKRSELERLVAELGISRLIRFSGWVKHPAIVKHYQRADIFVTPTMWEGMPNTVLEAMACGLPIVATDTSGCRELVRNGVNGYLVPVKDARALADALARLIENRYERRRMGKESRKFAEREFTWEQIAQGYVEVYRRVLEINQQATKVNYQGIKEIK